MLVGRATTGRVIVLGGTTAAGLAGIALSAQRWDWFDHVRIWLFGWHAVPHAFAVAIAGVALICVIGVVERAYPTSLVLWKSLNRSALAGVAARRRVFPIIGAIQDANESLAQSTRTLRGTSTNYLDRLDHFLRTRAPEIIRSPSLLDSELRKLAIEAKERESHFRQAADAYSSSVEMQHAAGRAIATRGSASMVCTLDNTVLCLESERERFLESADLVSFLARVAEVQEVLIGFAGLGQRERSGSSARKSTTPTPFDVLGITPDASSDTVMRLSTCPRVSPSSTHAM